ncbi:MAG: MFS transporter [Firmicutes bacterium]|nr:MFS transporter [Bacillota bacterium]
MKKILNAEYGGIHATYWMAYAVISSFASAYLLDRDYTNSEIGLILAVGSIVAVFLQPFMADFADRTKKISLIGITQVVTIFIMIMMMFCFVMDKASIALSVIFVMMIAWHTALQPLFNSLTFKLEESGHKINFGVCRAMGSLGYSLLCAVLGTLAENFGTQILPLTGEVTLLMLLITLCLTKSHFKKACKMRDELGQEQRVAEAAIDTLVEQEEINLVQFIKRNKLFLLVNIGVAGIFFSNSIFNSFMLQIVENVGGTSEDMGRILAVMAFLEIPPMFLFESVHKKVSCKRLLQLGAICFTLKILCATIADSVFMVYVAQLFQLTSFGIFLPAMVCFIDEIMEKGEAVKGQALYTIITTVATIFASLAGGVILDFSGASSLLWISTIITGLGALLFCLVIERVKVKK